MPMRFLDRHPRLAAALYLIALPAAMAAIVIGGTVDHYRSESRIAHLAREGKGAHDALCVLRADLERRISDLREFLASHPQGFAGIDAATLRNSIVNQQKTVDALASLRCLLPDVKGATP